MQRINRFIILCLCLLFALYRGRADKKGDFRKILIVPSGKIGDVVCQTPLYHAIKNKYPDSEVTVWCGGVCAEVLRHQKYIDELVVSDAGFLNNLWHLRRLKVDAACLTGPDFYTLALCFLAGTPLIVVPIVSGGRVIQETKPYMLASKLMSVKEWTPGKYVPREYLKLLEPLGIYTDDTKKYLAFSEAADKKVRGFLTKRGAVPGHDFLVGISPSAGSKIKEWPAERFAAVAAYAMSRYNTKIVIIGSKADRESSGGMIAALSEKDRGRIIDAVGYFDLDGLKALIAKLNIFIAVDTGPIYIAEAFNVPTIDIVGPVSENEQPPRGPKNKVVYLLGRVPQVHIINSRVYDEKEARRQVEEISVEMVIEKIDELMREIKK